MSYLVSIYTDSYKPRRCSQRNWEPGTTNSQVRVLGRFRCVETTLQEVCWRINMFLSGTSFEESARDWEHQVRNRIEYLDDPCGILRTMKPELPGFHQGCCNVGAKIDVLRQFGSVRIPFSAAYDSRQYLRNMDGCYMEIVSTDSNPVAHVVEVIENKIPVRIEDNLYNFIGENRATVRVKAVYENNSLFEGYLTGEGFFSKDIDEATVQASELKDRISGPAILRIYTNTIS